MDYRRTHRLSECRQHRQRGVQEGRGQGRPRLEQAAVGPLMAPDTVSLARMAMTSACGMLSTPYGTLLVALWTRSSVRGSSEAELLSCVTHKHPRLRSASRNY